MAERYWRCWGAIAGAKQWMVCRGLPGEHLLAIFGWGSAVLGAFLLACTPAALPAMVKEPGSAALWIAMVLGLTGTAGIFFPPALWGHVVFRPEAGRSWSPAGLPQPLDVGFTGALRFEGKGVWFGFLELPITCAFDPSGALRFQGEADVSWAFQGVQWARDVGVWQLDVVPNAVLRVQPGIIYCGRTPRLALRVIFTRAGERKRRWAVLGVASEADRDTLAAALTAMAVNPIAGPNH